MSVFIVEGKHSLRGTLRVNGAKNSALKLMVASLLGQGRFEIDEVPQIIDVFTMAGVLEGLGVQSRLEENKLELNVSALAGNVPKELAKSMRASVQLLGPLLARIGWVRVVRPGGCAIGKRPLDLHLSGLSKMGATIEVNEEIIEARCKQLRGADISLRYPSVGATENIMMAAALARGDTIIRNAAREPEIVDIQKFLNKMGARIKGAGSPVIEVRGVRELGSAHFRVIPDRIEAGTYLLALLISGGEGTLTNVVPEHLSALIAVLRRMGAVIELNGRSLTVCGPRNLKKFKISTNPYPGFPTDLQPQIAAAATQAQGLSELKEAVFDRRFGYARELSKLGAKLYIRGNKLKILGNVPLAGADLVAGDLRAGAALVLAALAAEGRSTIGGIEHIDRGYEGMENRLSHLGARIIRSSKPGEGLGGQ